MADDRYSDRDNVTKDSKPESMRVGADEKQARAYRNEDLLVRSPEEQIQYREENAADFAAPKPLRGRANQNEPYAIDGDETGGRGIGITALIVSILSLFILPLLMGIAGVIIGVVARGKGAKSLGTWAIIIGALSIVISIFILPFF